MGFQIDYFYRWNERIVRTSSDLSGDGAVSEIIDVDLAPNKLLISDPSGKIIVSSLVTAEEAETLTGIDTGQTIQDQLDAKQDSLTLGNLTEATSSVLTITGGTGAIIGSGLSIQVKLAGAGQSGYLSTTDWNTFNNKLTSTLTSAGIFVGNGSNVATGVAMSGVLAISNTGVTSFAAGAIMNADVNASAAIARTKIASGTAYRILANNVSGVMSENAALTASRIIVSDANGQLVASAATTTHATYISTLTSDVQTQINTIIAGHATNALVQSPTATEDGFAITWDDGAQEWALTDPVIQGIPVGGSTSQALMKDSGTDYDASWTSLLLTHVSDITALAADVNLLDGAAAAGLLVADFTNLIGTTSNLQTQIGNKLTNSLAQNALWVGNASNQASALAAGTNGYVLTISAGVPTWAAVVGTGTVTSIDVSGGTTGLTFSGGPVTTTGTITMSGTLDANNGGTGFAAYAVGDLLHADTTSTLAKLAAVSAGSFLRSGGVSTVSTWSTVKLPDTMSALGLWVANSANTTVNLTATANQSIRVNSGGTAWEAYTGIGGSTGSTDNAILRADGTGGVTVQAGSLWTISDSGNVVIGTGSAITGYYIDTDGTANEVDLRFRSKRASAPGASTQFYINGSSNSLGMTDGLQLIDFVLTTGLVSIASADALYMESQNGDFTLESSDDIFINAPTGNIALSTLTGSFGSGQGVVFVANAGTNASTAPTNGIILHARDSSDGAANSTLALYLEQAVEAIGTFTASHKLKIWINGTEYWIQLDAV